MGIWHSVDQTYFQIKYSIIYHAKLFLNQPSIAYYYVQFRRGHSMAPRHEV